MLHIYICEDNIVHKNNITECVKNYVSMENLDMKVALSTVDPFEIIEAIKTNPSTGLYFLDVDLNSSINGIQLAEKIREYDPRGYIVFITVKAEALQLTFKYKVEALDYIVKDDIEGIRVRICECISNVYEKYTTKADTKKFSFKISENKVIVLECNNILFFETSQVAPRKVVVLSTNSRHEFYGKLDNIQKNLDDGFFRCHKSYIVNLSNIEKVDVNEKIVYMTGGSTCLASVRQITKLKKLIFGDPS